MKRRNFIHISAVGTAVLFTSKFNFGANNNLPNVLILGDSISIGYTPFVKEILKYKANVVRPKFGDGKPENCQGTTYGAENIDRWLGGTQWDVIHFNFGLHDIKYTDPQTGKNSRNPAHPHQADLKQYKKNLKEIIGKLKATGAKLIFATTTPYPDVLNNAIRKPGLYKKYHKAAVKIMNREKIEINDLCAFMTPRMAELQKPKDVHFTEKGSKELAVKVAERIEELF